mmetsp:Transcript_92246/g.298674  ORF Transcript_92246/g.298674 Transcript_92246/m.298674 type:complete len:259 (+) Transcript_92246:26-802(+)
MRGAIEARQYTFSPSKGPRGSLRPAQCPAQPRTLTPGWPTCHTPVKLLVGPSPGFGPRPPGAEAERRRPPAAAAAAASLDRPEPLPLWLVESTEEGPRPPSPVDGCSSPPGAPQSGRRHRGCTRRRFQLPKPVEPGASCLGTRTRTKPSSSAASLTTLPSTPFSFGRDWMLASVTCSPSGGGAVQQAGSDAAGARMVVQRAWACLSFLAASSRFRMTFHGVLLRSNRPVMLGHRQRPRCAAPGPGLGEPRLSQRRRHS